MVDAHTLAAAVRHQEDTSRRVDSDPNFKRVSIVGVLNDFSEWIGIESLGAALGSLKDSPHDARRILVLELLKTIQRGVSKFGAERILDLDGGFIDGIPGELGGAAAGLTQICRIVARHRHSQESQFRLTPRATTE